MLHVYEFEVFKDKSWLIAYPFDFTGGTQGESEKEIAEMSADWLKAEIEHRLVHHLDIPDATFGNEPKHGGRVLLIAIDASLDTIDAVPAHKAAEMLGVSRGRVSQMVSAGLLEGFRKGRDAFVTVASIQARQKDTPKAGRPRKSAITV